MSTIHPEVLIALDEIDAAIFSGDGFHSEDSHKVLTTYLEKWSRESVKIAKLLREGRRSGKYDPDCTRDQFIEYLTQTMNEFEEDAKNYDETVHCQVEAMDMRWMKASIKKHLLQCK